MHGVQGLMGLKTALPWTNSRMARLNHHIRVPRGPPCTRQTPLKQSRHSPAAVLPGSIAPPPSGSLQPSRAWAPPACRTPTCRGPICGRPMSPMQRAYRMRPAAGVGQDRWSAEPTTGPPGPPEMWPMLPAGCAPTGRTIFHGSMMTSQVLSWHVCAKHMCLSPS